VTLAAPATTVIETPRFRIAHTPEARAAAQMLAAQVEPLRDHMASVLGRDWPGVTEVRLGMGREQFEALAPERPVPSWAVGLAWPNLNVVVMEARSLVQGDGQKTFRHELVHVALGQLGKDWPRWFQEGVAQVLTQEHKYDLETYAALVRAVRIDRVFRFDDLTANWPDTAADVQLAYAQSDAFVRFLLERHSRAELQALLDETAAGTPFPTAFALAFHTTIGLEETAFKAQLPSRYPLWPVITMGSTLWALVALMVVAGYARRRQQVATLRELQAAAEAAEDEARRLRHLEEARALGLEPGPLPPEPWEEGPAASENGPPRLPEPDSHTLH
jgi:Peptidase MA superfamily